MTNQQRLTYIAGDIMTRGSQLQRAEERDKLVAAGINVYTPQDNKSINDKQNAEPEGLAERIVREDMERLFSATDIVIEPQPHAQGTLVELGIIYGMKALAREIDSIVDGKYYLKGHLFNGPIKEQYWLSVREFELLDEKECRI